jgi:hypothetical protein
VVWLSRLASSPDTLEYWQRARSRGCRAALANGQVGTLLADVDRDDYALGTEGLNFLDAQVGVMRPRAVLELGSGASTVVLAASMAALYGQQGLPRVFSIDEQPEYLERTRRLLDRAGLAPFVRLAHRPLRDQSILGRATRCYDLRDDFLRSFLTTPPDLVLIDGPSGGGDVRYGTLPALLPHVRRPCRFFLDDALRADEIRVVSRWRDLPGLELRGVHLVGHGVLEGALH